MHRAALLASTVAAAACGPAFAGQLPGTLNFRNETATRIHQTNPETAQNEKEVEHGDFDNDGDLDVVVAVAHSDFGMRDNKLYRNDSGEFWEVSNTVPLFLNGDVARNAFFRDYNQDGWLDIIVVCDNNTPGDGGRTKIWINQHPGGVHTGWVEDGLARLGASTGGAACGAASLDHDGDGDYDLYVGNYPGPSQDTMYFNDGNGFFTNMTATHLPSDGDYSVDVSSADLNGDGMLEVIVCSGASNYVYYNDNQGAGSGEGDYSYPGSQQSMGNGSFETSMEPGDFDNDGDVDLYWSDRAGSGDRLFTNAGNQAATNQVIWAESSTLPPSTSVTSRKPTVADLNVDGRLDIFLMKEQSTSSRPAVLRNVTVAANSIAFVDWTPATAFPTGSTHMGWHASVFDTGGDGDLDVFLGGWANDHIFEQVAETERTEESLVGGEIPGVFNGQPTAVVGHGTAGDTDTYFVNGIVGAGSFISIVLNGPDDYVLDVRDSGGNPLTLVDRGGLGVEEAAQLTVPGGVAQIRVIVDACAVAWDLDGDCSVGITDLLDLLASWGNPWGITDLLDLLASWGPATNDYVLEVLSRSG